MPGPVTRTVSAIPSPSKSPVAARTSPAKPPNTPAGVSGVGAAVYPSWAALGTKTLAVAPADPPTESVPPPGPAFFSPSVPITRARNPAEAPLSPATTICPSGVIATARPSSKPLTSNESSPVPLKEASGLPSAFSRKTATSVGEWTSPATTILPSAWTATARPASNPAGLAKSVMKSLSPLLKAGSRSPVGRSWVTTMSPLPSASPTTTTDPPGVIATPPPVSVPLTSIALFPVPLNPRSCVRSLLHWATSMSEPAVPTTTILSSFGPLG